MSRPMAESPDLPDFFGPIATGERRRVFMSTLRRAFAVLFISAAVAAPVLVANRTLGDPQRAGSEFSPCACGNGKV